MSRSPFARMLTGGTRLKILEAMAMEKAVVSTAVGAEGLEVVDAQNILVCRHPEDMAEQVVKLLRNPALGRYLGTNGREFVVNRYDWKVVSSSLDALWSSAAVAGQ